MKNKILILFILFGITACAQKTEREKLELIIDKNIKDKVESKIKKSEYARDIGELMIYETIIVLNM